MSKLRNIIKEEIKKVIKEDATGKYKITVDMRLKKYDVEMLEDDINKVAIIKVGGKSVVKYKYSDSGVISVQDIDTKSLTDVAAYCIFALSEEQ